MFLEDIKKRETQLIEQRAQATASAKKVLNLSRRLAKRGDPDAKTVGLKIPADIRERIQALKEKLDEKSYSQLIFKCVLVGLDILENLDIKTEN